MEIVWTEDAILDVVGIWNAIVVEDERAAKKLRADVKKKMALLKDNPRLGQRYGTDSERRLVVGKTVLVFYKIREKAVVISSVRRSWQRPPVPSAGDDD